MTEIVTVVPKFADDDDGAPLPPFASYVTEYEFIVHCAYNVVVPKTVYDELLAAEVPEPLAAVFQPLKA